MHQSDVHVYPIDGPGDVSGLEKLIESGVVRPEEVQGVMVTHEGDLPANSFAMLEVAALLGEKLGKSRRAVVDSIPIQAFAGANAFMVPHTAVFTRREVPGKAGKQKRFAVAGGCTRRFLPHEIGSGKYIREVRNTTAALMAEIGITSGRDVGLVFAKTPWPNPDRYVGTASDGKFVVPDFWTMLPHAQGAAALGVALALGEVDEKDVTRNRIVRDAASLYSTTAQCSSTEDRDSVAVIVCGNTTASSSNLVIGNGVLEDGMDVEGVKRILRSMGFRFDCCPSAADLARVRYAWLKPKTSETSRLRGERHTLRTHSVLGPFWWMVEKGPVHAAVAAVLGTTVFEVATGPEHQGPIGKPLLAVLAEAS